MKCYVCLSGVLQKDTLAPLLFVVIIGYALRKSAEDYEDVRFTLVKRRSGRYPPQRITDNDFTDDITTFSDTLRKCYITIT